MDGCAAGALTPVSGAVMVRIGPVGIGGHPIVIAIRMLAGRRRGRRAMLVHLGGMADRPDRQTGGQAEGQERIEQSTHPGLPSPIGPARHHLGVRAIGGPWRRTPEQRPSRPVQWQRESAVKIIVWVVGILAVIGLLVVVGCAKLIF